MPLKGDGSSGIVHAYVDTQGNTALAVFDFQSHSELDNIAVNVIGISKTAGDISGSTESISKTTLAIYDQMAVLTATAMHWDPATLVFNQNNYQNLQAAGSLGLGYNPSLDLYFPVGGITDVSLGKDIIVPMMDFRYYGGTAVGPTNPIHVSITSGAESTLAAISSSVATLSGTVLALSPTVNNLYTVPQPVGVTRTPSIYTQRTTTFTWLSGTAQGYAYPVSWVANVALGIPVITCVSAARGLAGARVDFGDNSYTSATIATDYAGGLVTTGAGEQCWGPQTGFIYIGVSGTTASSMVGAIRGSAVK